jgi:hypothetical protein
MKPSAKRVLDAILSRGGRAQSVDLAPLALDYRRRIHELRKIGFRIETHPVPGATWAEYRLETGSSPEAWREFIRSGGTFWHFPFPEEVAAP